MTCPATCDAPENLAHCHDCAWQVMAPTEAKAREKETQHRQLRHDAAEGDDTDDVRDEMWATHPNDCALVVEAIEYVAARHGGKVDQNEVRRHIPAVVTPQAIGPTYRRLREEGRLRVVGSNFNNDLRSRNVGKPQNLYVLVPVDDRSVTA